MRTFTNPLAPRSNKLLAKSAEIKSWTRELMALPQDTPVSVVELACRDDGCPDIETVVGILEEGKPVRTIRLHMTMAEITYEAIAEVVRDAPGYGTDPIP